LEDDNDVQLKIVTFGDHDDTGVDVFNTLLNTEYDLLLLVGDYAYDVYEDLGMRGDKYFEWMESLMTKAPVILVPGNHEIYDNTRFFNNRFMMPGTRQPDDNNYFACESQRLEILGLNLDYLLAKPDLKDDYSSQIQKQLDDFDIRKGKRFSMYMSHRPFHCQGNYDECQMLVDTFPVIEKAIVSSQININLWGHVHHYERLPAIYNNKELTERNLTSFIVGTGGNKEGISHKYEAEETKQVSVLKKDPTSKAVVRKELGFLRMDVYNEKIRAVFYSTTKKKDRDDMMIFLVKQKENNFPGYLWVFIALLILFAIFVIAMIARGCWKKYNKKPEETEKNEPLIVEYK
jgi:hypothetical protein